MYRKTGTKKKRMTTSLLIYQIPVSLKRSFKAACARRGLTMTDVIKQMMVTVVRG